MPKKSKKKLPPLKETDFLTDNIREKIVYISNRVRADKKIRKSLLRDIVGGQARMFDYAVRWLVVCALIRETLQYPPRPKGKTGKGRKLKYLMWNGWESNDIVESVNSLIEYQDTDLSKFPVRDLDKLDDTQILLLKKYLFRIKNKFRETTKFKRDRVFNILTVEDPHPVPSIMRIYTLVGADMYGILKKLMDQGKINISVIKDKWTKKNRVVIFKDPDYVFKKTRWKCENCGKWSYGNNEYCGKCGDERR